MAQCVVRVLTSFKNPEMHSALKALSIDEIEIVLKFIYKGMEVQQDGQTCASLLAWHSQVKKITLRY